MLRLAQLKYPSFPLKVTPQQATVSYTSLCGTQLTLQFMVRETCHFASNYEEEIRSLGDPAIMAAQTAVVQFPYTEAVGTSCLIHRLWLMSLGRRGKDRSGIVGTCGKTNTEWKETSGYASKG